ALRGAESGAEPVRLRGRQIGVPPGLRAINADRCWYELGLTGAGTLICGFDTGVDVTHPALETKWRGHGGAHPPEECWYDCIADSVGLPYDDDGHGTHTMGTMCGLDGADGDSIGVAFGAQWIATNCIGQPAWCEEFDNDVIACFQWVADPDGDPETVDDVPDVCQNSWGGREYPQENSWYHRCDDLWWAAIDNCEAAGVVVTFSAGNNSHPMSCGIPADRITTPWNICAVGAVDATNYEFPYPRADFSSQGPSGCDETTIKPEVAAPGVDVVSSIPGDDYAPMSGTSMAGPHVAGAVALLREIDPDLDVERAKQILMDTAVDHGDAGEDNQFGWGVIDAYAACLALMNGYGNLAGEVVEAGGRLPIAGAQVRVPELGRCAVSDSAGGFDLRHLPAGSWQIVTERFGYDPDSALVVVEDGGVHFETIELSAQPRGAIAGVVCDAGGPLADVRMQILDAPVETILTAGDGSFSFVDLPVGCYTLAAGLFGWMPQSRVVTVTEGEETTADFTLLIGASDDFEIDQGWTAGAPEDDATEGIWQRGDPNPTYWGEEEVQPGDDHTADGLLCYVTHNQPEDAPRFFGDVDGGQTTLLSPIFDATAAVGPALTYWRWQHSLSGYPQDLELRCDVSNDGGENWVNVETFSAGGGGWEEVVIPLSGPGLTPTEQMRIRFIAEDDAMGAGILEAVVDDILITGYASSAESLQPLARLQLSMPRPNPLGSGALVQCALPYAQSIDLGIFDTAGRLVRRLATGAQTAGVHRVSWDARGEDGRMVASGVYFLRLSTAHRELSRKFVIAR
ncbi:MAG: S8 family serine peptidase, partial [Candidatus Eisenbacteria bacterium]|nr:S8 family serine peptidase [Candidatus Eisenbacteria bacterium]